MNEKNLKILSISWNLVGSMSFRVVDGGTATLLERMGHILPPGRRGGRLADR
jgi:hypothetical protein